MTAPLRLARVALNVSGIEALTRFYVEALGFEAEAPVEQDAALATLLSVRGVRTMRLRLGAEAIELCQADPPGPLDPDEIGAADSRFQHCALSTPDMAAAYARLSAFQPRLISRGGPVRLPQASGGATALKFRDPDGHPLELIQFPDPKPPGIDHSAFVSADTARSESFYAGLGFHPAHRQVNEGPEQDRLDGLDGARVEVVSLASPAPMRLELLGYRTPVPAPQPRLAPHALAATRLVFEAGKPADALALTYDPDGHAIQSPAGALCAVDTPAPTESRP